MGVTPMIEMPSIPFNNLMSLAIIKARALVLIYPEEEEIIAVQDAINRNWRDGIEKEEIKYSFTHATPQCYQFTLNGQPFDQREKESSISIRLLTKQILEHFKFLGLKVENKKIVAFHRKRRISKDIGIKIQLLISTDLSRCNDQTTWIFKRGTSERAPDNFFSMRMLNFNVVQYDETTEEFHQIMKQLFTVRIGVRKKKRIHGHTHEMRLDGVPWFTSDKNETAVARRCILKMFERLEQSGYILHANSNLDNTLDTLYFRRVARAEDNLYLGQEMCMISLQSQQQLFLTQCDHELTRHIKNLLRNMQGWSIGHTADYHPNYFMIEVSRNVMAQREYKCVEPKRFLVRLLESLSSFGYTLVTSLNLDEHKIYNNTTLLFRKSPPVKANYFCLSPSVMNKLWLINAPAEIAAITHGVVNHSAFGGTTEEVGNGFHMFEYEWPPWQTARNGEGIFGRVIMLYLLLEYGKLGWKLMASFDTYEFETFNLANRSSVVCEDVHSWFFMKPVSINATENLHGAAAAIPSAPPAAALSPLPSAPPSTSASAPSLTEFQDPPPAYYSLRPETPPPTYSDVVNST